MPSQPSKADDVYAESIKVLREASDLEHALMVQYLYAACSIKSKYEALRGSGSISEHYDLLGVAIEEMRHLHLASLLLTRLKSPPRLAPIPFPFESEYYPFPMELERLSAKTLAKYVYVEAPENGVNPDNPNKEFITRLKSHLGIEYRPNMMGSLYGRIIELIRDLSKNPPGNLLGSAADLADWISRLCALKQNGTDDHFSFFRDVFMGTSALVSAPGGKNLWDLPDDDSDYPSLPLTTPLSDSADNEISQEGESTIRELVRLGNLHYWIVLGLLNMTYRYDDWQDPDGDQQRRYMVLAQRHMRGPLLKIGLHLAERRVGLPFAAFPKEFDWDNEESAVDAIRNLLFEANEIARNIYKSGNLINGFRINIYSITLVALHK